MSFRARITIVLAVIVALATVAVSLAALGTTRRQLYAELDQSLAQLARVGELAPNLDADNGRGPRIPPRLRLDDPVVAQVHQADGSVRVVAGTDQAAVPDRVLDRARSRGPTAFATEVDGVPYRGLARPLGSDAVLVVAADASEQARVLRGLLARLTLIGLLVAGGAALAGWFAAGRLVAPLTRLTAAAEQVSATGDLDVDVRTDEPDEAGRLSRALDEMLAALAASQAAQQQLVDDAGHELRTPITSILSNAEVLKRHPDLDAETRAAIADDVIAESQELTRLVNSLVDLAGVTGAAEEPSTVDLAELAQAAVRRLPADQRDRVVVTGQAQATLRAAQVQRAVVNLLTNAAKFDPSGGPIEVAVAGASGSVEISVRDHGPGFAPDDLPHVFARFYRSDTARGTPGSGLGLAIVKDVAQRNGGGVTAANHPEGGGIVRMSLPTG